MLLAELVSALDTVAATSSRLAKTEALAGVFRAVGHDEIEAAAGFASGWPRQGKIGVGWAQVWRVDTSHAAQPSLTIADLDSFLEHVQSTTGPGSVAQRAQLMTELLSRATEREADFIRRLLVGELRQGALESVTADAVAKAAGVGAPAVRRALMLSGDLGRTAAIAMHEGETGLAAVGLRVLRPVQPMLASASDDVTEALAGPSSVEWKLDGIRIQVHRQGDEVRIFTRNLNDITTRLPEVVEITRSLDAHAFVLDAEAIAVDERQRPRAFQQIMSRIGRHTGHDLPMVPYFFDVLHIDGEDLIDRPLLDRRQALESIAPDWLIPSVQTELADVASTFLSEAIAAGHEGIVVKSLDSVYAAGRRGKTWRKVKPVKTFDLVVLGAEWGHGRRTGRLSNLHLGARDPATGGFLMVGKTFKGLTDELLAWQTQRLQELASRTEGITVFTRPELVVEIELDGVQVSPRYPGGIALRFARVVRYREDKDPRDADTIDSLRELLP